MAEEKKRLRTTYTVLEEVKKLRKEHSETNDKSAEITALLKEAIELLPSSVDQASDLNKLNSILKNSKKILSDEQKAEISDALNPQKKKEENVTALSDKETANNLAAVLGGVQAYIIKREEENNKNRFNELLGKDPKDLTNDELSFLKGYARDGLTESDSNRLNSILEARPEPEQAAPEQPEPAQSEQEAVENREEGRRTKLNELTPEKRLAVVMVLSNTTQKDTLLDLALQAQQETPNYDDFIKNLAQKARENGNFSEQELTAMDSLDEASKVQKALMTEKLNTILAKGTDKLDDADISQLNNLALLGIEVDRINEALNQHQTYLNSQTAETETDNSENQQEAQDTPEQTAEENTDEQINDSQEQEEQEEQEPTPAAENQEENSADPVDEPLTVTPEEREEYITELKASDNEADYLRNIDPKISTAAIESAMALEETPATEAIFNTDDAGRPLEEIFPAQPAISAVENRATALANPDDMLVALDYYTNSYKGDDKDAKIAGLKEVINHNLSQYKTEDINPESAFVLLTLAEKIKDEQDKFNGEKTYNQIAENIAYASKGYDLETFGKPQVKENGELETKEEQAARLDKNYTNGLQALEGLDAEKTMAMLAGYTFTNDNGKPLKGKALNHTKEDIIETARLMTAKDLAKNGMPKDIQDADGNIIKTAEAQLLEKMQENIDKIMAPTIDDKVMQAIDAAIIGTNVAKESPEFAKQKKALIHRLQAGEEKTINNLADIMTRQEMGLPLEGELPKEAKKEYKKKLKANTALAKDNLYYSKSNVGARLGAAMVQGPETFKTRLKQKFKNTDFYKNVQGKWKALDEKLDKRFGKAYRVGKKIAKYAAKIAPGAAKNAALYGLAGMVPGGIPALIVYNTCKNWKQMGKALTDPSISKGKKASMLIGAGLTTALGAITASTGIDTALRAVGVDTPAMVQFAANAGGYLGVAARTTVSTIAATLPNWVEKISLNMKEKKIKKQLAKEKDPETIKELIEKQKEIAIKRRSNNDDLLKKGIGVAVGIGMSQVASAAIHHADTPKQPDMEAAAKPAVNTAEPAAQAAEPNALNQANPFSAEFKPDNAFGLDSDTNANTDTVRPPFRDAAAQAEAESMNAAAADAENTNGNPDEVLGRRAENLAAAEEKGSGHLGKSDMESMQKDMDSRHGELLNFSAEEKAALMKSLAEGYGNNSYEAMHAAMAEPNALAHAMGLDGHYTSATLLNHMAAHPELADNAGFKAYVAEHFDEQDRFHSSSYTVHTETHTQTHIQSSHPEALDARADTPAKPATSHETKITYTPVDHLPGEQPTSKPEPQVIQVHQTTQTPIHVSAHSGLIYDPMLSEGLDHSKYQGAYLDPSRMIGGKPAVVYVPNDTLHDSPHVTNMDDAVKAHDHAGGDTLGLYRSRTGIDINNPENNSYYGYGYGSRVCYGTGVIGHTTVSTQEISFGKALGQEVAVRATDIALRQGEHALHHLIENKLGWGRN